MTTSPKTQSTSPQALPFDSASTHHDPVQIVLGDCLEILRSIPDASVDAVVTDPPYALDASGAMLGQVNQNYATSETHGRGYAAHDADLFKSWARQWAAECLRVLKPGGHLIAFGGTRTIHQLVTVLEEVGFEIRDQIIWAHGNGRFRGRNLTDVDGNRTGWRSTMTPTYEPAVLARRPCEASMTDNVARHGTGALNDRATRYTTDKERPLGNVILSEGQASVLDDRFRRLFFVAKATKAEREGFDGIVHPTVKPLDLMRTLVRLVTPVGGLVLDPFAGSGTTALAADAEGTRCLAIEQDPGYVALARHRLSQARAKKKSA